ncbi:MAG TPA: hypothetical protein VK206_25290 [Anaerolineales bacterium]|nr:hypothetical protein [Anaerolineales bacterium]
MKSEQFVLIHAPDTLKSAAKLVRQVKNQTNISGKRKNEGISGVRLKRQASSTLVESNTAKSPIVKVPGKKKVRPITVGLWDLGAWIGGLGRLIEGMNRSQKTFVLFEVKATVPPGVIKQSQGAILKLEKFLGFKLSAEQGAAVGNNFFAADYYALAEPIRNDLKIDYLVGITPSMIADTHDSVAVWNLFSTFDKHLILVSSYQLRDFAEQTTQPFEAFLATIITAQIFVAKFFPKLGFHSDTGCLFDYNEDRVSIINKVLSPVIEESCIAKIPSPYDSAAQALVKFICSLQKK